MGNFIKCQLCENNRQEYKLDFLNYEVVNAKSTVPVLFTTLMFNPIQTINIYKYKCSNGHIFKSTYSLDYLKKI